MICWKNAKSGKLPSDEVEHFNVTCLFQVDVLPGTVGNFVEFKLMLDL